jgi:acetyltransferase-like isoleucine patch superfamily enzyme
MKDKTNLVIQYILGFPKSLYVNFRLLKPLEAIRMPIFISHKTSIRSLSGKVIFDSPSFACLKIGFGLTPLTDFRYDRSILNIKGEIIVHGKSRFGAGSKIHVFGTLEIGANFNMTGKSTIVCHKRITFGTNALISWNVLLMDTDQHTITTLDDTIINPDKQITLGSNVWICSGTSILKGVTITNNIVIGAHSHITKDLIQENAIYAGNPAKLVKKNIKWR